MAHKTNIQALREKFEAAVLNEPHLKNNTPLGVMEINGAFDHYMDPDTDTLWIGFALGYRVAESQTA